MIEKIKKSDNRLVRNSIINLTGQVAPLIAAFFAIPLLIRALGVDKFGALSLAWMLVGYFSVFDMGLSRTIAHISSKKLAEGKADDIPTVAYTAFFLMALLGLLGSILLCCGGWFFADLALSLPDSLIPEMRLSLFAIGLALPFVILTSGFVGLLQSYQKFVIINYIRVPAGVLSYLVPAVVVMFTHDLAIVVTSLSIVRLVSFVAYAFAVKCVVPCIYKEGRVDKSLFKTLFSFGGWLTVSNIVAPIMLYMDRFIVGSLIALSAVAYYTTPFDVVTKLLIIPASLMGVFFPAFSASIHTNSRQARLLYHRVIRYIALILFPICLTLFFGARWGLTVWLHDASFASASYQVAQLLIVGVFFNSLAQPSFNLIQAAGRPDLTAKVHLLELPFYVCYLWWFVSELGIIGAAAAWFIRTFLSSIILFMLANKQLNKMDNLNYE